jgi:phage gp36-like protein
MSYSMQADLLEQISSDKLTQLTDDADTGSIDADVIARAIADADAEIDGYCGTRYTVPFTTVPAIIRKVSVDITIYNLYARRKGAPDDRQKRYDNAIKFLANVSKGLISLGADDPDSVPADTNTPEITQSDRIFTRDKMDGF